MGDNYDKHNYRPVSIIPFFAKVLERLMYNTMTSFLYENKILSEAQNGFRKDKSIDTAVQSYIEIIQEALDKRAHTIGIFIDLSKAYDVLNHTLLLEKLPHYGIRGSANSWFRSHLFCRRQFIEICQSNSNSGKVNTHRFFPLDIEQGVPQGSVLGPLLFLLYINDLHINVHDAKLVMFADDISVLISDNNARELQNKIDRAVTELETWLNRNNVVINTGKTGVMSFHNGELHLLVKSLVTFNRMVVAYTSETKIFGIQITDTLKWHSHIQLLADKFTKVAFMTKPL
jgi:phage antirepressor YoqD-like protein